MCFYLQIISFHEIFQSVNLSTLCYNMLIIRLTISYLHYGQNIFWLIFPRPKNDNSWVLPQFFVLSLGRWNLFLIQVLLRTDVLQLRPNQGSNLWPPDHDSTVHVTETPALTTWPSVTLYPEMANGKVLSEELYLMIYLLCVFLLFFFTLMLQLHFVPS